MKYIPILTAQNGCDSTISLALTVRPIYTTNLVETICDNDSIVIGNQVFVIFRLIFATCVHTIAT